MGGRRFSGYALVVLLATGCGDNLVPGCDSAADCPGTDSECETRVCSDRRCTLTFATRGHVLSSQVAGDCSELRCGVDGNVESIPADDPPDGAGSCIGCSTASDCPGTDDECQTRTCSASGLCGFAYASQGTPRTAQQSGDCALAVCDGSGGSAMMVDDADVPVDVNLCTDDLCTGGVPSNPAFAAGATCGTGVCDGAGACTGAYSCGRAVGATAGAVAADVDGTVLVVGYYNGPSTFGAGEPGETVLEASVGMFVARYRSDCTLVWVRSVDGADNMADGNNDGLAIAVRDGIIYVAGSFAGTVTFGSGESHETALTATASVDAFVARYAADGSLDWVRRASGTSGTSMHGTGVAISPTDGTVYTSGWVEEGEATFGAGEPGQATVSAPNAPPYITRAMFVARYQANGSFIRVRSAGGVATDRAYAWAVAATADGGALAAGNFTGTVSFGPTMLTSAVWPPASFIARYNEDGSVAWAKQTSGGETNAFGVAASPDGRTFRVVGAFVGTATFGAGETNQVTLSSAPGVGGNGDVFLAAFNEDGTLAWAKRAGGPGFDVGFAIAVDAGNSSVLVGTYGGPFNSSATFGEGAAQTVLPKGTSYEQFIARYDADGNLMWALKGTGPSDYDDAYGVCFTADQSVVAVGRFAESVTFDPGQPDAFTLTGPADSTTAFVSTFRR